MYSMNETTISLSSATKLVKKCLEEKYCGVFNVKVKAKVDSNDLTMTVKEKSKINGVDISRTRKINQGEIEKIIKDHYVNIFDVMFEPYFHNLTIRYYGELNLEAKKKQLKIK